MTQIVATDTIKHEEPYQGCLIQEFIDWMADGNFSLKFRVMEGSFDSRHHRWMVEKSGFPTINAAMEYGIKLSKDWIDQQLSAGAGS